MHIKVTVRNMLWRSEISTVGEKLGVGSTRVNNLHSRTLLE
jgi:hypothetical protein